MKRILFCTTDFPPLVGGAGKVQYEIVRNFSSDATVVTPAVEGHRDFDANQSFPTIRYRRGNWPKMARKLTWRLRFLRRRAVMVLSATRTKPTEGHVGYPGRSQLIFAHLLIFARVVKRVFGIPFMVYELAVLLLSAMTIRPTEIHIGYPGRSQLMFGHLMNRFFGVPYMVYTYAMEVPPIANGRHSSRCLQSADAVYTISRYTESLLIEAGVNRDRIVLIAPSIGEEFLDAARSTKGSGSIFREELGIDDAFTLLTVARVVPRKGHDNTLRALALCRECLGDWAYLIAGDGPYRPYLEQLVQELGLASQVHFLGRIRTQERLKSLYHECDVFVMPNRKVGHSVEGFGLVFLEAGAFGKPVIGGNSGGAVEAVIDGKTGILVDPDDPASIAEAIMTLYRNESLRLRMGESGRRRLATMPRWREIARHLERVL